MCTLYIFKDSLLYFLCRDIHTTTGKLRRAAMQFTPARFVYLATINCKVAVNFQM